MFNVNKVYDFIVNHWKDLSIVITAYLLVIFVLGGAEWPYIFCSGLLLIIAIITRIGCWKQVLEKIRKLAWKTFRLYGKAAFGGYGLTAALFTSGITLFILGIYIPLNRGGATLGVIGVMMIIGGLVSVPKKKIHG